MQKEVYPNEEKTKPALMGLYCEQPFRNLELHQDSKAYLCCPSWTYLDVGDFNKAPLSEIWNSTNAQKIRASILDGTYSYCNKDLCPHISGNVLKKHFELEKEIRDYVSKNEQHLKHSPRNVMFSFDPSCNLSCPSCRSQKISYQLNTSDLLNSKKLIEKIMSELFLNPLENICLNITGSGDPFSGLAFRQFLETIEGKHFPNLSFDFQTNGLLLTPRTWENISKIHENIHAISISIDAATEESYKKLRRGGDWTTLIENLKFLSQMRFEKKLFPFLRVNFVVQKSNYKEMTEFVKLFTSIKVDEIYFSQIADWGSMSELEFQNEAIHLEHHKDHFHFLNVLADPLFHVVNLGNLTPLRKKALVLYAQEKNIIKRMKVFANYEVPLLPKKIKKFLFLIVRSKVKNN